MGQHREKVPSRTVLHYHILRQQRFFNAVKDLAYASYGKLHEK